MLGTVHKSGIQTTVRRAIHKIINNSLMQAEVSFYLINPLVVLSCDGPTGAVCLVA